MVDPYLPVYTTKGIWENEVFMIVASISSEAGVSSYLLTCSPAGVRTIVYVVTAHGVRGI